MCYKMCVAVRSTETYAHFEEWQWTNGFSEKIQYFKRSWTNLWKCIRKKSGKFLVNLQKLTMIIKDKSYKIVIKI